MSLLSSLLRTVTKAATSNGTNKTTSSSNTSTSNKNTSSSISSSGSGGTGTVRYSGAGGNAPSDTKIGDLVVTGGGTYQRVAPNTAGATYNPTNGFWSVKVNNNTTATPTVSGSSTVRPTSSSSVSSSGNTGSGGNRVLQVGQDGNAPAGAQIGDIVRTGGGDFQVVSAGTPGATYNPANGLWSVKVNGSNGAATRAEYTPLGSNVNYQLSGNWLTPQEQAAEKALSDQWYAAQARGDTASMAKYHALAEEIRANRGYSGGADGSMYIPIQQEEDIITAPALPTYQPQITQVNSVYDAAKKSAMAALQSAYDNSKLELERYAAQIPGIYQEQANSLAAQQAMQQQQYNEYAAQSGLNTGNSAQARLAMNNQMQNSLGQIRTAEANAAAEAQYKLSALYTEYQGKIAEAIANNEYERAAALLTEYKEQQQSIVSVAQNQAQLDMNVAGFNRDTKDNNWQKQAALAEAMAAQGDFSGYRALGVSEDQINSMRRGWLAQNPSAAASLGYR